MLDGLRHGGLDLGEADLIVGTSAGALAGEALAGGGLERALRLHRESLLPRLEMPASTIELMTAVRHATTGATDAQDAVRRIAAMEPVGPRLIDEAQARCWFGAHLSAPSWPDARLLITAVDAGSGERSVFDASSGVRLLDAVMASCAVPGVFPLVTIDGRRYVDGGLGSPYNADLAAGSSVVVVLSPLRAELRQPAVFAAESAALRSATVHTAFADATSIAAIGPDLSAEDPVVAAMDAGAAQAARELERLRPVWLSGSK